MLATNTLITPVHRPPTNAIPLPRGRIIFAEGDRATTLHLMREGFAKLTRISPTSREVMTDYVGPGELLGNLNPQGVTHFTETATLVTDATLEPLEPNTIYTTPYYRDLAIEQAQARAQRLSDRVLISDMPVPARVLAYLLDAHKRFNPTSDPALVHTPFTQDDLAALLDTSRVTITRTLKELAEANLIHRQGKQEFTFNPETLDDALLDLATN